MRRAFFLLFLLLSLAASARATTYYVSAKTGVGNSDSNNGTSKSTAWLHAPGMFGCTATCNSTTLNPGDRVILEGCVTWTVSSIPWLPKYSGTAGNVIYYGVDKTWWDSSVSGCSTAWNRPILNAQGTNFQSHTGDLCYICVGKQSHNVWDNIEFTGYYTDGGGPGNTSGVNTGYVDWGGGSEVDVVVENSYFHGEIDAFFSIGTGTVQGGTTNIINYVPYTYSPSPGIASNWLSLASPKGGIGVTVLGCWGVQSNGPSITSITQTGSSWTIGTTSSQTLASNCNGVVVIGIGAGLAASTGSGGGNGLPCTGCVMLNNVIDGLDSTIVQLNPNTDCGVQSGNNKTCRSNFTASWRMPPTWIGNEIRFVCNGAISETSDWHYNVIEYWRPCGNPTSHTNLVESVGDFPVNGISLFYNNVLRFDATGNPNTPEGQNTPGEPFLWGPRATGNTLYVFNNVAWDNYQGVFWQRGSASGTWYVFNNSSQCGPDWNVAFTCSNGILSGDTIQNNHFITSNANVLVPKSGNTVNSVTNLIQTLQVANSDGYSSGSAFGLEPTKPTGHTIGAGSSISSICGQISAVNSSAGSDCLHDTTYGIIYNTLTHTVTGNARTACARPSTPDIGAFQSTCTSTPTAPTPTCTSGGGVFSSAQTFTCSDSAPIMCWTNDNSTPVTNGPGASTCSHGTLYSSSVTISTTATFKIVGGGVGFNDSTALVLSFTINGNPQAAIPVCTPSSGTFPAAIYVTCTDAAPVMCWSEVTSISTNGSTGCGPNGILYVPIVNLLTWSQALANSPWVTDIGGTTAVNNSAVAPDSTTTATTVTANIANGDRFQFSSFITNPGGVQWTFSVYLKVASGTQPVTLLIDRSGSDVETTSVTATTTWTRFTFTHSTTWTGTCCVLGGFKIQNNGASVLVWGAQLEQASSASTYQMTSVTLQGIYVSQSGPLYVVAGGTGTSDSPVLNNVYSIIGTSYPIAASGNGRYFVTASGAPWIMVAASPQAMPFFLTPAQMGIYMADRANFGYNAIWVWAICGTYNNCPASSALQDGQKPFTSGTSENNYIFSSTNPSYWSEIDNMVNQAAANNLVVLLNVFDTGLSSGGACNTAGNGFLTAAELAGNGPTGMFNYGQFIGNRYKNFQNIFYVLGDDFQTNACSSGIHAGDANLVAQIMAGIESVDANHLVTLEMNFNFSYTSQNSTISPYALSNSIYNYTSLYDGFLSAYNAKAIPTHIVEAYYTYQNNLLALTTGNGLTWPTQSQAQVNPCGSNPVPCSAMNNAVFDYVVRVQDWWAMTSGGSGFIDSNWFEETNGCNWACNWQGGLDGNDATQKQYVTAFFNNIPWQTMVPDQSNTVVTAGSKGTYITSSSGTGNLLANTYVTTAWNPSGTLAVVYDPPGNTLTVNMGVFTASVNASWYDPTNGTFHAITGSPFTNSGTHNFATPGTNSRSTNDWVLLLQVTPPNPPAASPVCVPAEGQYPSNQHVTCTDASPSSIMCYFITPSNGQQGPPTPIVGGGSTCNSGTQYTGPLDIILGSTLSIVGGGVNYLDSPVSVNAYALQLPRASDNQPLLMP